MDKSSAVSKLKGRIGRLAKELRASGLRGAIVAPGPNLKYYTGVSAHLFERPFMLLIQSDGDAHLIAPELESGPFRDSVPLTIHSWNDNEGPSDAFRLLIKGIGSSGTWGCDGRVPFAFLDHLLSRGLKVKTADVILQTIREVKEPEELDLLRKSSAILSSSILKVPDALREGMTEKELARSISEWAIAGGVDEVDPMVQSGARSADPHSDTSSKKMRRGETVVVDVVSSYEGYTADITRTFVLGSESSAERTYRSVLSAQEKAIASANAGATVGRVDAAARDSLEKDGLGKYFIHRTGHGLGLEVHEAPYIVSRGRERLKAGMVFTVEPGAYIRGKLGVRIEDDLVIPKAGKPEVTTATVPKEYGWWRK